MNDVLWTSVAPLWSEQSGSDLSGLGQPTILRFANDSFMDEFANILANQPARLADYRAWPETWREPLPQPASVAALPPALREFQRKRLGQAPALELADHSDPTKPLKLYQPAHQRYYLVTACLACRLLGFPDRHIDGGNGERVAFVMRRLLPKKKDQLPAQLATTAQGAAEEAGLPETLTPRWGCSSSQAQDTPPSLLAKTSIGVSSPATNVPGGECDEYAFVTGPNGPTWQVVSDGSQRADGEELLPLFPVNYTQSDGHRRRILAGLVPVGRREAYLAASRSSKGSSAVGQSDPAHDPRLAPLLASIFTRPWQNLIDMAAGVCARIIFDGENPPSTSNEAKQKAPVDQQKLITATRLQIQQASWFLLLDLAQYLEDHIPDVLKALGNPNLIDALPDEQRRQVARDLHNTTPIYSARSDLQAVLPNVEMADNLGDALVKIKACKYLEDNVQTFGSGGHWPDFFFPLVDVADNLGNPSLAIAQPPYQMDTIIHPEDVFERAAALKNLVQDLHETIRKAPARVTRTLPPLPLAAQVAAQTSDQINDPGWFVIRCIFERPNCLPVPSSLVSEPTLPFQVASFFDSDAPARPIRIALPVDTTPAGLRKFDKNAAFMISDVLCGQIQRAKGLGLGDLVRSVLPWPLHKDLSSVPDTGPCGKQNATFGMICSLSIPIVTICALILLIIIVTILDYIFGWLPYLIFCFPLLNFRGKKASP